MTIIKPKTDEDTADVFLAVVQDLFEQAVLGMNELSHKIRAQEVVPERDIKTVATQLGNATNSLIKERDRVVELRKKSAGVAGDYAIDFDAARAEIGRRLACLRDT